MLAAIVVLLTRLSWGMENCCPKGSTFCPLPTRSAVPTKQPRAHVPAVRPLLSVALVRITDRNGHILSGSGTLIWKSKGRAIVLTCSHNLRGAVGSPIVIFRGGHSLKAKILKTDTLWDLAVLEIRAPDIEPMQLADVVPRIGDSITAAGCGPGTYRAATGRVTQFLSPQKAPPDDIIEFTAGVRQGDSGGPMINARGRLAGVIAGSDSPGFDPRASTHGTHIGRIRKFLASVLGTTKPKTQPPLPSLQPWTPPKETPSDSPLLAIIKTQGKQIAALEARIAALERLEPIPAGNDGERGPPGMIDYSNLPLFTVKTVLDGEKIELGKVYHGGVLLLPPLTVQTMDGNRVIKSVEVYIGGDPLSLQLVPINLGDSK